MGGCSWVVGAQGEVGRGGSCFDLWKLGGNPDLGSRELGNGIPEPLQLLLSLLCIGSQPCLRAL